jgi:hypothetical protein
VNSAFASVHGDSSWSGVRCDRNTLALLSADSMCIWISVESNAGAVFQLRKPQLSSPQNPRYRTRPWG